ncbi:MULTISPECIES: chromosome partitioning protein ParB [unclassified Rhodococcus (in: high G+C Gram-positive bacteria)]|uniref:chromosome partitioning protein ParB n=1 Tax=unclassified Rhodococcus (in: high G+C Gram-positive bacteria) TaxID=192944 RepID=UPI000E289096|nr:MULTISPECIES: chromosome partitioning protein ParB [unclassified Rhodococcus (in: high G+C Gram-positive bacteria)]MDI9956087.1 chromosome partitioning protein ParB [Rhodococcus sp. IEGM 1237]MDI9962109.1 chromosome partitioning protein ParB [Rhodococcus sp. IEGM 1251]MDV8124153.1 chromosome partitioning protein ParB [Rhodococcus sp. IEGM 1304]REK83550.1 chromosome partitioning protein ParB [Rhodococcus erythropolis]
MARDTGFPTADAENDFARQRRRADVARLVSWLRREPDDVNAILPFDEVVAALGKVGEKSLGLQVVTIESIVGSVDRTGDFDRYFRPTSTHSRARWERLAVAQRRGESVPPVQLYRVGSMHFVIDGHHRVSIACAMHQKTIDAYVTEIITRISPEGITQRADLLIKDHRRLFLTRVPLQGSQREAVQVTDPWEYAELSECVEAWGFRLMQEKGEFLGRDTVARRWFGEEFLPVVRMLRGANMLPEHTDAEAYLWIARERYRLVRRHMWNDEIVAELRDRAPRKHKPAT